MVYLTFNCMPKASTLFYINNTASKSNELKHTYVVSQTRLFREFIMYCTWFRKLQTNNSH